MRLSDEAYESIKQFVANMFIDYDIKEVPIDAFDVARKMGISVIPYSALGENLRATALKYSTDGFSIENRSGKWCIYYNDAVGVYERINQTIMHEIGHITLGHIKEGEEEEAEAKFFAKYALVSPVLILNMKSSVTVENIMKEFKISYQAAVIAFNNYHKRFTYGPEGYMGYEKQILVQLQIGVA